MIQFNGNILVLGCGAVSQCSLPLIFKEIKINPDKVTVIDPIDNRHKVESLIKNGLNYEIGSVLRENYQEKFQKYLKPGDICIDLASGLDTCEILTWCQNNNILYLNTALNAWRFIKDFRTYDLYNHVSNFSKKQKKKRSTAIISHGANPGLVSSFAKQALIDLAMQTINENPKSNLTINLELALQENNFSTLANLLNIKTIHISEEDSQISSLEKDINEFINTWSIFEFVKESTSGAEISFGSHENLIPKKSDLENANLFFKDRAMHINLKSWLPDKEFNGIIPAHDENFSISDYLTIKENGKIIYRPTTIFVYNPNHHAKKSLNELKDRDYLVHENHKIMNEDILSGADTLGCLLLSENKNCWWTGTKLSIEETNKILPSQNATVMQVSAGVISALKYMIENPNKGICFPEQLDHTDILKYAKNYLGEFISKKVNWVPKKNSKLEIHDFFV